MSDRSVFRQQYQNQVAELGEEEPAAVVDEAAVARAYQLLEDHQAGLVDDSTGVEEARQTVEHYEAQLAIIRKVRLHCCANALDKDDALDLMEHLGVAPHQAMLPVRVSFSPTSLPDALSLGNRRRS